MRAGEAYALVRGGEGHTSKGWGRKRQVRIGEGYAQVREAGGGAHMRGGEGDAQMRRGKEGAQLRGGEGTHK